MVFGNWKIEEKSIRWNGGGFHVFEIPARDLTRIQTTKTGEHFYQWIMLATEEDWLTQNDLYDLNYAFVYKAAVSATEFDYDIFDATLAAQYDLFDAEDAEDGDPDMESY